MGPPIALFPCSARRPDRARAIQGWGSYYLSVAPHCRYGIANWSSTDYRRGAEPTTTRRATSATSPQGRTQRPSGGVDRARADPRTTAGRTCRPGGPVRGRCTCETRDLSDDRWTRLVSAIGEEGAIDLLLVSGGSRDFVAVRALRLRPEADSVAGGYRDDRDLMSRDGVGGAEVQCVRADDRRCSRCSDASVAVPRRRSDGAGHARTGARGRLYRPTACSRRFLHGGGFVIGRNGHHAPLREAGPQQRLLDLLSGMSARTRASVPGRD